MICSNHNLQRADSRCEPGERIGLGAREQLEVQGKAELCFEGTPQLLEPQSCRADTVVGARPELHHDVDVPRGIRLGDRSEQRGESHMERRSDELLTEPLHNRRIVGFGDEGVLALPLLLDAQPRSRLRVSDRELEHVHQDVGANQCHHAGDERRPIDHVSIGVPFCAVIRVTANVAAAATTAGRTSYAGLTQPV
jgi:hypothetical protein